MTTDSTTVTSSSTTVTGTLEPLEPGVNGEIEETSYTTITADATTATSANESPATPLEPVVLDGIEEMDTVTIVSTATAEEIRVPDNSTESNLELLFPPQQMEYDGIAVPPTTDETVQTDILDFVAIANKPLPAESSVKPTTG